MNKARTIWLLAAGVGLVVAALVFATLSGLRGDNRSDDGVRVVTVSVPPAANHGAVAQSPVPVTANMTSMDEGLSVRLEDAIVTSFPMLNDVSLQCDKHRCTISSLATEPSDGAGMVAYEEMIRSGLASAVQRAGVRLAEPVQIEEVGPNKYRLLIHTTLS